MRIAAVAAVCMLSIALFAACGVAFTDGPEGNEFFSSLQISGDKHVGKPLTAAVGYRQYYPVVVPVRCELWQSKNLVKQIGEQSVPEYPGGSPKVTPFPGNFSFDFTVDAAGDYRVECFSSNDEENLIAKVFHVS